MSPRFAAASLPIPFLLSILLSMISDLDFATALPLWIGLLQSQKALEEKTFLK
jgi:hypothetical protein